MLRTFIPRGIHWILPLLAAIAFLIVNSTAANSQPAPNESASPIARATEKIWQESHFVLGKIVGAKRSVGKENMNNVTFQVKVTFDNTAALVGHEIAITGPEYGMNATLMGRNMADLTTGDTSIFGLKATNDPNAFDDEPDGVEVPIAVVTGMRINPQEVELVHEALDLTTKYLPVKDAKKNHNDAIFLLKSKNHYLSGLGGFLLGLEGTNEAKNLLENAMMSDDCSIDKFLWLAEQLPDRSPQQQLAIYQQYMRKHSQHLLEPAGD